jgi:uncharacterized Zn finger protein (UPF0148 family)
MTVKKCPECKSPIYGGKCTQCGYTEKAANSFSGLEAWLNEQSVNYSVTLTDTKKWQELERNSTGALKNHSQTMLEFLRKKKSRIEQECGPHMPRIIGIMNNTYHAATEAVKHAANPGDKKALERPQRFSNFTKSFEGRVQ